MERKTSLDPQVKAAIIKVAGEWALELQKPKPNYSPNDLVNSFRDIYGTLATIFLMPQ